MILSDRQIREAMARGEIVIDPFRPERLGSNSYDVSLGPELTCYLRTITTEPLNSRAENPTRTFLIEPKGHVLWPGVLYLGSTVEYTETHRHVAFLDGKSSTGRLGIFIHTTAGRGDVGFCNHWTMEISVVEPIIVYAGMPIGQLTFFESGPVDVDYSKKANAKYRGRNPHPMPSAMWKNYDEATGEWK